MDIDPVETREWLDALSAVKLHDGVDRASFLIGKLSSALNLSPMVASATDSLGTAYINTISVAEQPEYPGNIELEEQIESLIRWNAALMVVRAQHTGFDLGGHIGTYASAATLYEVGFNHFWRAQSADGSGSLVLFQGHASPGIYARSFLEGRFSEQNLDKFRQEVHGGGLSSYPHPWLMPEYWQFPTVSMGLGPLQAIYTARFNKYMQARGQGQAQHKVWCFCGDGEMDEPESIGALPVAARENLDNLVFVVNCNLQRLDGPVRGNGKIIQELEQVFRGCGWDVIKVIWSSHWDRLLAQDSKGILAKRMAEVIDGEYQNYLVQDISYFREHFFGKSRELAAMVADWSDAELASLNRGGHDPVKVYAAYAKAAAAKKPTVILLKTVKGYGLGAAGEGLNTAHNTKKMNIEQLKVFRDRFSLPITDKEVEDFAYFKPSADTPALQYLQQRRNALGGYIPARLKLADEQLTVPGLDNFAEFCSGTDGREISSTMAFVRFITKLCKDKSLGERVVPIVPDESRTFGMEGMFRQLGIYSVKGQLYTPVDAKQVMYYKEAKDGQILQEGINEAGAFSSWLAAATSYSTHNRAMLPFYIFYSMFGFQRIGDLAWAAGDSRARGFLLGATAGRTTLNGEGLQHEDGNSMLTASLIPNCVSYDPTFNFELAVILQDGMQRMLANQEDVFYYISLMNENYAHPVMPEGAEQGIIKGLYKLKASDKPKAKLRVQLLGSGTILNEVLKAQEVLREKYKVEADVWSATSFNLLARDGIEVARWQQMHPGDSSKQSYIASCLPKKHGPVVAATDYVRAYAEQVRAYIPGNYTVLGTDGFGRSDSRANLRAFFEVDHRYICVAALNALLAEAKIEAVVVSKAIADFELEFDNISPLRK